MISTKKFLTAHFPYSNLAITNRVLCPVLAPKITDNTYHYCTWHCANDGPQLKLIDFYQSSYQALEEPTIGLIVTVSAGYDLTIGIVDVTNTFQNNIKTSFKREIIDWPPNYIWWFPQKISSLLTFPILT